MSVIVGSDALSLTWTFHECLIDLVQQLFFPAKQNAKRMGLVLSFVHSKFSYKYSEMLLAGFSLLAKMYGLSGQTLLRILKRKSKGVDGCPLGR